MRYTFSDQLLYVLAAMADYNRRSFSVHLAVAVPGDPRLTKYRRQILKYIKNKNRQKIYSTYDYLKRRNYFIEEKSNGVTKIIITEKGKMKILKIKNGEFNAKKLPSEKSLIVFFDVPEKLRKHRTFLRLMLKQLNFERVQKSVWQSPYDSLKQLKEIINELSLNKFVQIIEAKRIKI